MHRSSDSIGAIAAALAKAQTELINPEKSLVGIIGPSSPREPGRSFRYAPLSSGLDIARKNLGRHAIAVVQSTSIDNDAGIVRLYTVLAHSSGEWVSSEWPVCPIGYTASPQRMGAALTYARRYALFALVGIAGEDDLDAPDLQAQRPQHSETMAETKSAYVAGKNGYRAQDPDHRPQPGNGKQGSVAKAVLSSEGSASLRQRLLNEVQMLDTAEVAVTWASKTLGTKNSLTTADARLVEDAFRARIACVEDNDAEGAAIPSQPVKPEQSRGLANSAGPSAPLSSRIDKSVLSLSEPRRLRDRAHVKYVSKRPCLICGRQPSDPHHLRFAQQRALGRKVSDEFVVPLCRSHHREVHRSSDKSGWWKQAGIDSLATAHKLWRETHPVREAADQLASEIATKELDERRQGANS